MSAFTDWLESWADYPCGVLDLGTPSNPLQYEALENYIHGFIDLPSATNIITAQIHPPFHYHQLTVL